MRILLVSGSMPPMRCGVGDYTDALAGVLADQPTTRVAVLTSRRADDADEDDRAGYERFAAIDDWSVTEVSIVSQLLRSWRPDVVHLQYPTQGYRGGILSSLIPLLAWQAGAVPVRTWHEGFSGRQSLRFLLQSSAPGPAIVVRPNFTELIWRPLRPFLWQRAPTMIAGAASIPPSALSPDERAALRSLYLGGQTRLIVFFGFVYPAKGVDQLFDVADPVRDAIVIAGELDVDPGYTARIRALAGDSRWAGRVTLTGFLPVSAVADLLSAADVVILPFIDGGGSWNSSISAAILQGTPVVTTSKERHGLDETRQVYFAQPNDLDDMRRGLGCVARRSVCFDEAALPVSDWLQIRDQHMAIYETALTTCGNATA